MATNLHNLDELIPDYQGIVELRNPFQSETDKAAWRLNERRDKDERRYSILTSWIIL